MDGEERRQGVVWLEPWAGQTEPQVGILSETAHFYVVRVVEGVVFALGQRVEAGEVTHVPRGAVRVAKNAKECVT